MSISEPVILSAEFTKHLLGLFSTILMHRGNRRIHGMRVSLSIRCTRVCISSITQCFEHCRGDYREESRLLWEETILNDFNTVF